MDGAIRGDKLFLRTGSEKPSVQIILYKQCCGFTDLLDEPVGF